MKNLLTFAIVALFALGSCTDEVLVIDKQIDTVWIEKEKFIDRTFVTTDTINIETIIEVPVITPTRTEVDTVFIMDTVWVDKVVLVPRVDSIFVERILLEHDTIVINRTVHADTLLIYPARSKWYFPSQLEDQVNQFYIDAQSHGRTTKGYIYYITVEEIDDVLQAYSYPTYGQINIVLNGNLTWDEMYLPLMREMSRWELGTQYSQDPTSVRYPFFDNNKIRWSNRHLFKTELKEFFI